jgi:FkbM family methyltransferase
MRQQVKRLIRGARWKLEDRFRARIAYNPWASTMDVHYSDLAYQSRLRHLLKTREINVVIDVGANAGQFALVLRGLGYTGRIVSFEPGSQALETLTQLASDDPAWTVRRTALGRTTSELLMNVSSRSNFNSFLKPNEKYSSLFDSSPGQKETQETVPVVRLDDVWSEIIEGIAQPRCLLKIDTQGFDTEVIAGGAEVAVPACLAIQFEGSIERIYEGQPACFTLIEEVRQAGFMLAGLYPCAFGGAGEVIEVDCLMFRS